MAKCVSEQAFLCDSESARCTPYLTYSFLVNLCNIFAGTSSISKYLFIYIRKKCSANIHIFLKYPMKMKLKV